MSAPCCALYRRLPSTRAGRYLSTHSEEAGQHPWIILFNAGCILLLRQRITGGPITSSRTSRRGFHNPLDTCLVADLSILVAGGEGPPVHRESQGRWRLGEVVIAAVSVVVTSIHATGRRKTTTKTCGC